MEKEGITHQPEVSQEEIRIIDGKKYRKVESGYTIRQFFSHETIEKGPGPGWDTRRQVLRDYNVDSPSDLPDTPYYFLEPVDNE